MAGTRSGRREEFGYRSAPPARWDLDLASAEWLAEIDRLRAPGATVHQRFERHAWTQDPGGNAFCVVAADGRTPSGRDSTR